MIEPATFRFVAQHLNHCATSVPHIYIYIYIYIYTHKYSCVCVYIYVCVCVWIVRVSQLSVHPFSPTLRW